MKTDNCYLCGSSIYWFGRNWYCDNRKCTRFSAPMVELAIETSKRKRPIFIDHFIGLTITLSTLYVAGLVVGWIINH